MFLLRKGRSAVKMSSCVGITLSVRKSSGGFTSSFSPAKHSEKVISVISFRVNQEKVLFGCFKLAISVVNFEKIFSSHLLIPWT